MRAIFAALAMSIIPMTAAATEEPDHEVVLKDGKFEVRQYAPMIVAEVEVTGDMRRAGSSGFRPLADYIFGNNTAKGEIAMTAPVTRTPSQKIEMTAPVTRTPADGDSWTVAFVMPGEWTIETLPEPNNAAVTLREEPGKLMATVRFSGEGRAKAYAAKQEALETWIAEQGYEAVGPVSYAGYSSPWTPSPLKRQEVMVPVVQRTES